MASSRVSVVVVSFNTREKLAKCLACIEPEHQVIVVDNASRDGSADWVARHFPNAILLRNNRNRGFGAANNQGIDAATGELLLLLNSDAYPAPGAISRLALEFASPEVVAAGGQLLNPDGSRQLSSASELTLWAVFCEQTLLEKLVPNSRFLSPYWNSHRIGQETTQVDQVMGACLMMRPKERFDERFFLYCEDTELCRRLSSHGKILYVPEAKFTHDLGSSSESSRWLAIARYNRGKELYFAIHSGRMSMAACWLMNRMGAAMRLLGWIATFGITLGKRPGARSKIDTFWKVLTAPFTGPPIP